jgi:alkylation response protein AidB-like acyl-CoA dehydrogenase
VDFELSDDQVALGEAASTLLASAWDRTRLRELVGTPEDSPEDHRAICDDLWSEMCAQGWTSIEAPGPEAGLGLGLVEVAVLCEAIGRSLAPAPILASIVAQDALRHAIYAGTANTETTIGSATVAEWLDRLTTGDATASASFSLNRDALRASFDPARGWLLAGRSDPVVHGPSSDLGIVVAHVDLTDAEALERVNAAGTAFSASGPSDAEISAPASRSSGDRARPGRFSDRAPATTSSSHEDPLCAGRAVFLVPFADNNRPRPDGAMDRTRLLGRLESSSVNEILLGGPSAVARLLNRYVTGMCAEMLGSCEQVLEMTVAYAKDRIQFGRPIGSFQAVKHRCADMLVDVEGMRSVTYYAAWAVGNDAPDSSEAASAAKTWCADAAARVMASGLQVHGGIGFTWEHDLHLYLKRSQLDQVTFGDAHVHRGRLANLLRARIERGEPIL